MIAIGEFCSHHEVEITFIRSLQQYGLLEIMTVDQKEYFASGDLPKAERMVRFHHELGINFEGIDVLMHLLQRVETMQHEILRLKNKLDGYEG